MLGLQEMHRHRRHLVDPQRPAQPDAPYPNDRPVLS
jgi:hypothetical protein